MELSWSHTVLNIKDVYKMLDFYIGTLGFDICDRGPLVEKGPEIIFMSQDLGIFYKYFQSTKGIVKETLDY
jgi:hypothetical protein